MKQKKTRVGAKKGFSLIEVLLALFVLSAGLVATLELTAGSISQVTEARDSLIAASLAQEGIELARNIRDNRAAELYNQDGFDFDDASDLALVFDLFPAGDCEVDAQRSLRFLDTGVTPVRCSVSPRLRIDGEGFYRHGNSGASEFSRQIQFVDNGDESYDVVSTVTWNGVGIPGLTENCNAGNSCIREATTLTQWILHK